MDLEFSGELWFWKGPAPWHFVTVPERECGELEALSTFVSYGWGMIPVTARIGHTGWTTSLFPKDGQYIVPVKASVRRAEGLEIGDTVTVRLAVGTSAPAARLLRLNGRGPVGVPGLPGGGTFRPLTGFRTDSSGRTRR